MPDDVNVRIRVLKAAAGVLGGPRKLRAFLRVRSADLLAWQAGTARPPDAVFLRALQVLLDDLDRADR
jgi:hypothetical protein